MPNKSNGEQRRRKRRVAMAGKTKQQMKSKRIAEANAQRAEEKRRHKDAERAATAGLRGQPR